MRYLNKYCFQLDYQRRETGAIREFFINNNQFVINAGTVPEDMGQGSLRFCQHEDGMGYGEFRIDGVPDTVDFSISLKRDCLKMPFLLSKLPIQVGIEGVRGQELLYPSTSYLLSPDSAGTISLIPEIPFHTITFFLPLERMENLVEDCNAEYPGYLKSVLMGKQVDPYLHHGAVTPSIRKVVDQIRYCPMSGSLRSLYLEGKILELSALRLQELCYSRSEGRSTHSLHFSHSDRNKIQEAVAVIESSIEYPPTICQLAKTVGINTTKLKCGFRSELGITVFGYIHQLRMREAFMLLRDSKRNVTEVALSVGYSDVSSFSAAFKKQYGFKPSSVRNRY